MPAAALLVLAVALQAGAPDGGPPLAPDGRLGPHLSTLANLMAPADLEFAPDGTLWVVERDGHRVARVAARGGREAVIGSFGDGPGELRFPRGLALTPEGDLLVADTENDRVVRFAPDGGFEGVAVGRGGALELDLRWPEGLDVRGERLALCDRGNRRVVVTGGEAPRFLGAEAGLLDPVDVHFTDDDGALAVADAGLHEVVLFSAAGVEVGRFGGFGHFPGQFARPVGLDFAAGRLYVADADNHRVQVFGPAGELLYEWGKHALEPGQGAGFLHYPAAVAVLPNGLRAAIAEDFAARVQRFGPADGPPELYRNDPATLSADTGGHVGPPVAAAGRLVLTIEPETQQLHFHDLGSGSGTPIRVHRAGGFGPGPGQFRGLVDVALSADGRRALALDARDRRLSEFAVGELGADGPRQDRRLAGFARSVDLLALVPDLGTADALALGPEGRVLVVDGAGRRLIEVAADWRSARTVLPRPGSPGLRRVVDLALRADGERIAVADAGARAVLVFDRDGALVDRIDGLEPGGVAFDGDGNLLLTDRRLRHVRTLGEVDGTYRAQGSFGRGRGVGQAEFDDPRGLALGPEGRLVIVDHGNHLLTVVEADGRFVGASGPRSYLDAARPGADPPR